MNHEDFWERAVEMRRAAEILLNRAAELEEKALAADLRSGPLRLTVFRSGTKWGNSTPAWRALPRSGRAR